VALEKLAAEMAPIEIAHHFGNLLYRLACFEEQAACLCHAALDNPTEHGLSGLSPHEVGEAGSDRPPQPPPEG